MFYKKINKKECIILIKCEVKNKNKLQNKTRNEWNIKKVNYNK